MDRSGQPGQPSDRRFRANARLECATEWSDWIPLLRNRGQIYRLEATATGFVSNITLVVKTPSSVNIRFQIAGVATSVTVESLAPLINRTDASLENTLQQDQLSE
jgi:hypothetical protein